MSLAGSGRSRRRRSLHLQPPQPKKSQKCLHFLISCCVFFALLSACLIAALVFIGKHFYYNDVRFQIGTNSDLDLTKQNSPVQQAKMGTTRLPNNVLPLSYDLTMYPIRNDRGEFATFNGSVNITTRIVSEENVRRVILNTKFIKLGKVEMQTVDGSRIDVHEFRENTTDEIVVIYPGRDLLKDEEIYIKVDFTGNLRDRVGFYRSFYFDKKRGLKRSIATTKFEPTYARQAFPCFDEPNLKANFTIHIIKPKDTDYIALSNMPVKSEIEVPEGIKVSFEESVKMPTYLACWVVSDFQSTDDIISSPNFADIPYRVFATPAQLAKTEYAAFVGKKVMEYYLDYFKIAFPLPKLDMLAIPDYSSGATEHWGIVTFRETSLLFDKNISTTVNRRRVATVIAHELAHSWFGNLVTMNWWDDLWLNEGFASYIEYKGVDAVHPDWKMLDQFVLDDLHNVLKLDATLASHPIVQTVVTPDQITQLFDTISYSKGASILRMLENSIGAEIFRTGVTNYLNKHAFANAITQDLLDQFQYLLEDHLNLTEYLNTWTQQMGYPIITATRTPQGFRLTQKRFLTDPDKEDKSETLFKYRWTIPVTYFTAEDLEPKLVWFNYADSHVDVSLDGKFVKFNARQVGYYRVNYDIEDWNTLIDNIKEFSTPDRTHLLEESFRIAESTLLPYDVPLNLSKYLRDEFEHIPWSVASTMFSELKNILRTSSAFTDYQHYVISLVKPAVNNYTWNETDADDHLTRLARSTVLNLACAMGEENCLNEAKTRLHMYLYENVKPSPDLKGLVYKYGMVNANKTDWEKMWTKYVNENDAGEKDYLIKGLASIKDETQLHRLLDLAKDDTYIRKQDYPSLIAYISYNSLGTQIVWIYFRENWGNLVERFGLNDRYLHNMIPRIASSFATNTQKEELLAFFEANPEVGAGAAARKRALEYVQNNINWLKRNKDSVESWIENNK